MINELGEYQQTRVMSFYKELYKVHEKNTFSTKDTTKIKITMNLQGFINPRSKQATKNQGTN